MISCIVCGKNKPLSGGICGECLSAKTKVKIVEPLKLELCPKCGSIRTKGKWHDSRYDLSHDSSLRRIVTATGKAGVRINSVMIDFDNKDATGSVEVELQVDGQLLRRETVDFPYNVTKNSCDTCNKLTGSYFEAIIQIRSISRTLTEETRKGMEMCVRAFERKPSNTFISKVKKLKEGYDIYVGNSREARKVTYLLKEEVPCFIQETKKLAGRGDGEDLFRYTFLVRILDLERGSVVKKGEEVFVVKGVSAKQVQLRTVSDPRIQRVSLGDFQTYFEVFNDRPMRRAYQVVSRSEGETQLMDKEDFKIITIKEVIPGDTVEVVFAGGTFVPV
ncbi:MAG: NMD3-related protein [Candidatus Thermoplasmatota archaeon]|jgi:nonsense-mediated mRNA decay protein 3|nr:NMD3-related protein [Candidatus Thermoplasmatota archaeon]MCL5785084.1 NMD3-related protein [Candidatus Thermoplasmatota archaeon]